jgi:Fe-S-cluster containining protein
MLRGIVEGVTSDAELVQIVDAAVAEAVRLGGSWIVCRAGCAECCRGPFPITQLDVWRLQRGLAGLERHDPACAAAVRERARAQVASLVAADYPGDPNSGMLEEGEEAEERFAALPDDDWCPALDPVTLKCDLYSARPITCRVFGPAITGGGDVLGACELNFAGASDAEIAACQVEVDPEALESRLLNGEPGQTTVAFALR